MREDQTKIQNPSPNGTDKRPRRSRGKASSQAGKETWWPAAAGFLALLLCAGIGFYIYSAQAYRTVFFPNTFINGVDVSGRSLEVVKKAFAADADNYQMDVEARGTGTEVIRGAQIGLHTVFDGKMEAILKAQNPYKWVFHLTKPQNYKIKTMISYDDEALEQAVAGLACMDESRAVPPQDAHLSEYISGRGYEIIPEVEGSQLKKEMVLLAATDGVLNLRPGISLEEMGCYVEPSIRSDDPGLAAARDARNHYVNTTVTYTFGDTSEVLSGDRTHLWLQGSGADVSLDDGKIKEFVAELAEKYNTAYKTRSFQTSYGPTVKVSGSYGWRINQSAEAAELKAVLEAGESVVREPVYAQKAAAHGAADYGNTYAEVNLTAQHLIFYKDGVKLLESDFVSGNIAKGHTTPAGIYSLTYKQKDAVLRGEGYASPVKYWMPFNGGIGFHDASWRSSFGGSIYKNGGSHGCVNMPYAKAEELFKNVYAGMPVICYNLEGTESKTPTKASGSSGRPPHAARPAQTQAAPPAQTPPAVPPAQTPPAAPPVQTPPASQPDVLIRPVNPDGSPVETPAPTQTPAAPQTPAATQAPAAPHEAGPAETTGYGPGFVTVPSTQG